MTDADEEQMRLRRRRDRQILALSSRGAFVAIDPARCDGGPVIGGTSIPTEAVAAAFAACGDKGAVAQRFRITPAHVMVAVWFERGVDSRRRYIL